MKLLVVEDDTRIADIVRRTLTESGYAVDVAFTIPTAIEAIEIETYDLVVLDLMLPGAARGGIDVCRRIRHLNPHTPVLMLTALDTLHSKQPLSYIWADLFPYAITLAVASVASVFFAMVSTTRRTLQRK